MNTRELIASKAMRLVAVWIAVTGLIMVTACTKKKAAGPTHATKVEVQAQGSVPEAVLTNTPSQQSPPQLGAPTVVYYDQVGKTSTEIFDSTEHESTEGVGSLFMSADGQRLHYSKASVDDLTGTLSRRILSETDERTRNGNLRLAADVGHTTLNIDFGALTAKLVIYMFRGGQYKKVTMTGPFDQNARMVFGDPTKFPYLGGELACVDVIPGCQNAVFKLLDGSSGEIRHAYVLVRETPAYLYVEGMDPRLSRSVAHARFMTTLLNSITAPGSVNSLRALKLATSETVLGSSTFVVSMEISLPTSGGMASTEILGWTGPLVKSPVGNRLELPISLLTPSALDRKDSDISVVTPTLRATELVRNDSHGNIMLRVSVGDPASSRTEPIWLTISRIGKPVRFENLP